MQNIHYWTRHCWIVLFSFYLNLQDAQDVFLEQERDRALTHKLVTLQKAIRGWHYRQRFKRTKINCITLQKYWRAFVAAKKYQKVVYSFQGGLHYFNRLITRLFRLSNQSVFDHLYWNCQRIQFYILQEVVFLLSSPNSWFQSFFVA